MNRKPIVNCMKLIILAITMMMSTSALSLEESKQKTEYFSDKAKSSVNADIANLKKSPVYSILDNGDIFYLESLPKDRRDRIVARLESLFKEKIALNARESERNIIIEQIKAHNKLSGGSIIRFSNGDVVVPEKRITVPVEATTVNGQVFFPRQQSVLISPSKTISIGNIDDIERKMHE